MVTVGQSLLPGRDCEPNTKSYLIHIPLYVTGSVLDTGGAWEEKGTHSVLPDLAAGLAVSASLGLASHLQSKWLSQLTVNQNGVPNPYRLLRP